MDLLNIVKQLISEDGPGTSEFVQVIKEGRNEYKKNNNNNWNVYISELEVYKQKVSKWDNAKKVDFIVYCMGQRYNYSKRLLDYHISQDLSKENYIREEFIIYLLKKKLMLNETLNAVLINAYCKFSKREEYAYCRWPIGYLLRNLLSQYKGKSINEDLKKSLKRLRDKLRASDNYYRLKENQNQINIIDEILFYSENPLDSVKPELFIGKDAFAFCANKVIEKLPSELRVIWYQLIAHAKKANGGKPTAKYLKESAQLIDQLGKNHFKKVVHAWFKFIIELKEIVNEYTRSYNGTAYTEYNSEFITSVNTTGIKGFVWMSSQFHDKQTIQLLSDLTVRCFKKIPGKGPASIGIGNACIFSLYKSKGLDGIGQLSRLKLKVKQANTQNLIQNYLLKAAEEKGISVHEIEDLAVDDFGLQEGKLTIPFGEYKALLEIIGVGKCTLVWEKAGKIQKSVPAVVKQKYAEKLKKLKKTKKQIEQTISAQRDRLDRMFRQDRTWRWEVFEKQFLNHGLMGFLCKKLIWCFDKNQKETAIYYKGKWQNENGELLEFDKNSTVRLWHPALANVEEVRLWRNFMMENEITQPLKQAFREVYLLTDAEINTRTYSNRMAAHVLKQHQFNMLAKGRGWKYSLMGCYDDGRYNEAAELSLPEFDLRAEYWINELNTEDAFNDTGIWDYITTDQVRFINTHTNDVMELVNIPAIALSEVMRDVDLFVGVASVGNDPAWQDSGGLPVYRDYWHSYSFGNLTEVAKTRKEILERLLPRLKIANVATIQDKFLVVEGKVRTYKIHIGSTNILMEPNDQYLCIVPDRSKKNNTHNLFVPFEGDNGLSLILSKAFLLADDDKITDQTILSQIGRRW